MEPSERQRISGLHHRGQLRRTDVLKGRELTAKTEPGIDREFLPDPSELQPRGTRDRALDTAKEPGCVGPPAHLSLSLFSLRNQSVVLSYHRSLVFAIPHGQGWR